MSDESAGRSSEKVPDFMPGWFDRVMPMHLRQTREAVRVVADHFPTQFLRPDEYVSVPAAPQRGFTMGRRSGSFQLAVPPGHWIVRTEESGRLCLWGNDDFQAAFERMPNKLWTPPALRHRAPEGSVVSQISDPPCVDDEKREADAQEAINAVGEVLDRIAAPEGATFAERVHRLESEAREKAAASIRTLMQLCQNQAMSHLRLRDRDPDHAEYHRGAQGAYEILLGPLAERLPDNPHLSDEDREKFEAELMRPRKLEAEFMRARKFTECERCGAKLNPKGGCPNEMQHIAPPWPPPEGSRVRLIYDALRLQDVLSFAELREFAAAVDTALEKAEGALIDTTTFVAGGPVHRSERPGSWIDEEAMARGAEAMTEGIEKVDDVEDTVDLEERCDQLLEQREVSRAGEDHFKAQRDAALRLLRWLTADLIDTWTASDGAPRED